MHFDAWVDSLGALQGESQLVKGWGAVLIFPPENGCREQVLEKEEGLGSVPTDAPSTLHCTASLGLNTKIGDKICASSPFQEGNRDTEAQVMRP